MRLHVDSAKKRNVRKLGPAVQLEQGRGGVVSRTVYIQSMRQSELLIHMLEDVDMSSLFVDVLLLHA